MKIISLFILLALIPVGSSLSEERQLEKGNATNEALQASLRKCCDDYESYVNGELDLEWSLACRNYFGESIDTNDAGDMLMIKLACTNKIEKNLPEHLPGQRGET